MTTYTIYLGATPIANTSGTEYTYSVWRKTVELAALIGSSASLVWDDNGEVVEEFDPDQLAVEDEDADTQNVWETTQVGEWLDAKFQDVETGEIFFVELKKEDGEEMEDFIAKCHEVADENFEEPQFCGLYSGRDAECLGYDTY